MRSYWTRQGVARQRVGVSALLPILMGIATPALAGQITGVDNAESCIPVRFDRVVETRVRLIKPARLSLDRTGDITRVVTDPANVGSGPADRVRHLPDGLRTARFVFDLATPHSVTQSGFSDDARSLTLAATPNGSDAIIVAIAAPHKLYLPHVAHRAVPPRSRFSVTIDIPAARPGLPRPRIMGPTGRPLVVIDAGHGGHDPGATGAAGILEKDLTLVLAKDIRDELLKGGRVRVALTREDDRFLVLQERVQIARGIRADLFISIHADSAPGSDASGATIYTLSEVASGRNAASLATRENRADVINGVNLGTESSDVSSILIDLAQRETMNASARFADLVKREGRAVPFKHDYHQMAGFAVLKAPDTPAILLEAGYISSVADVARLTSVAGKRAIAQSLRRAVEVHFARRMALR